MVAVQVGARQSVINARWLARKVDFSAVLAVAELPLPSARAHSLQPPRSERNKTRGAAGAPFVSGGLHQADAQDQRGSDGHN